MKSAKTMNCKMCMVERKEILQRMKTNKHKLINDNSDIFARCSCKCRFHKFFRTDSTTLRTRLMQKKITSTRHSKLPRVHKIFTFSNSDDSSTSITELCSPCNSEAPTPASSEDAGFFYSTMCLDFLQEALLLSQCPTLNLHKFNIITSMIT